MPEIAFVQGGVIRTAGATAGTSSVATTITPNAVANTKGSWAELIAATEFDANWVVIQITNVVITALMDMLVDIGIGAATEQVIIPDLVVNASKSGIAYGPYAFPLYVPKGSRLTARCQNTTGTGTANVSVVLCAGTLLGGGAAPSYVSAYGAVASSTGTAIDGGAVANTDSAWTQLTAATDRAHNWLVVAPKLGDLAITVITNYRISVGIGAATEQALVPDLHFTVDPTSDEGSSGPVCLPAFVPSGSRLTAKVRSSNTTAGDRAINLKVYGAG